MLKEFKKFILRGNMIDLAVGMIIGSAFNAIVSSLVNDVFMPLLGRIIGNTRSHGEHFPLLVGVGIYVAVHLGSWTD